MLTVIRPSVPGYSVKHHPVKVTALEYLREALSQERYEEMKEIAEIAKEFGATYWELHNVLTHTENES